MPENQPTEPLEPMNNNPSGKSRFKSFIEAQRPLLAVRVRQIFIAVLCGIGLFLMIDELDAAAPATSPTSPPNAASIIADMKTTGIAWMQALGSVHDLFDPEARKTKASKIIPLLKRMEADRKQIQQMQLASQDDSLKGLDVQIRALLCLFDDSDTQAVLANIATGTDAESVQANAILAVADFWRTHGDPIGQEKALDAFSSLAKKNPGNPSILTAAAVMVQMGAASDGLQKVAAHILYGLDGSEAQSLATQSLQESADLQALRSLEKRPMVISGPQIDGTPFTTAKWKGHVVLVVFWATWCRPCVAEMPRVVKLYSTFHAKGLEVLGVTNDFNRHDLEAFLARHRECEWPQLWDPTAAQQQNLNSITTGFDIRGIPTMFLIDRKGICYSVSAETNLEDMVAGIL